MARVGMMRSAPHSDGTISAHTARTHARTQARARTRAHADRVRVQVRTHRHTRVLVKGHTHNILGYLPTCSAYTCVYLCRHTYNPRASTQNRAPRNTQKCIRMQTRTRTLVDMCRNGRTYARHAFMHAVIHTNVSHSSHARIAHYGSTTHSRALQTCTPAYADSPTCTAAGDMYRFVQSVYVCRTVTGDVYRFV